MNENDLGSKTSGWNEGQQEGGQGRRPIEMKASKKAAEEEGQLKWQPASRRPMKKANWNDDARESSSQTCIRHNILS